ncbi:MAG TPA: hypothetical protein VF163_18135 [Micromonosporaceae bacterium]
MKRRTARSDVVWRYLPAGQVKHALPGPGRLVALCGRVAWIDEWLGTDGVELAALNVMSECRSCAARLVATTDLMEALKRSLAEARARRMADETDFDGYEVIES